MSMVISYRQLPVNVPVFNLFFRMTLDMLLLILGLWMYLPYGVGNG